MNLRSPTIFQDIFRAYVIYRIVGIVACVFGLPILIFTPMPYRLWELAGLVGIVLGCGLVALGIWLVDLIRYG